MPFINESWDESYKNYRQLDTIDKLYLAYKFIGYDTTKDEVAEKVRFKNKDETLQAEYTLILMIKHIIEMFMLRHKD